MSVKNANFNRKKEAAVAALLTASSVAEAAKAIGVAEATLNRWIQDVDFQTEFRSAKKRVLNQAINSIQSKVGDASQTLQEIMNDGNAPPSSRIQAARTVLEYAFKGLEYEEIIARLDAIEAAMSNQGVVKK